ncbi:N-terminal EF-hand calcium-binding protein 1, partial [Dissostichus eleginoides]
YLQSNSSKDFQRCVIDMLEEAEAVSTMLLPESNKVHYYIAIADGDLAVWAARVALVAKLPNGVVYLHICDYDC